MLKYFTAGSMDEPEGLTLLVNEYDENGVFVAGYPHIDSFYKVKEIDEETYNELSNHQTESFGIVNDVGSSILKQQQSAHNNVKIDRFSKKVAMELKTMKTAGVKEEDFIDSKYPRGLKKQVAMAELSKQRPQHQ